MGYILGQYNKLREEDKDVYDPSTGKLKNLGYMSLIRDGSAARRRRQTDFGVTGEDDYAEAEAFWDECVDLGEPLEPDTTYYFHGKIKRLLSNQVFYIRLVKEGVESEGVEQKEQYIKTIVVAGGDPTVDNEWVDVEFIFTPLDYFNSIMFKLQRTTEDYRTNKRYPIIIYQELSVINNKLPFVTNTANAAEKPQLLKMGVQGRPNLKMCVNREDIRTGKTGIYEVRNGSILVYFFSIYAAAQELCTPENEQLTISEHQAKINQYIIDQGAYSDLGYIDEQWMENLPNGAKTLSICLFDSDKTRTLDSFTLDYMYEVEDEDDNEI